MPFLNNLNSPFLFLVLTAWSLVWKGIAMWKAAERKEKWWFIALLVINSLGVLDLVYILVFSKKVKSSKVK